MVWEWKGIVGPIIIRSHIVLHWKFIQLKFLPMVLHKVQLNISFWTYWMFQFRHINYCVYLVNWSWGVNIWTFELLDWQLTFIGFEWSIDSTFCLCKLNSIALQTSNWLSHWFFYSWMIWSPIVLIVHQWLQVTWIDDNMTSMPFNINHSSITRLVYSLFFCFLMIWFVNDYNSFELIHVIWIPIDFNTQLVLQISLLIQD